MFKFKTIFILSLYIGFIENLGLPFPLHASCKISWTFGDNCKNVFDKIVAQINLWNSDDCGTGQKCLYQIVSTNQDEIKAIHTTPVRKYIDNLTFNFMDDPGTAGCVAKGFSTSRTWYAVLDYGTNYCNLHNLIDGAGLTHEKSYSENTRNAICTQYTSANCEKY